MYLDYNLRILRIYYMYKYGLITDNILNTHRYRLKLRYTFVVLSTSDSGVGGQVPQPMFDFDMREPPCNGLITLQAWSGSALCLNNGTRLMYVGFQLSTHPRTFNTHGWSRAVDQEEGGGGWASWTAKKKALFSLKENKDKEKNKKVKPLRYKV